VQTRPSLFLVRLRMTPKKTLAFTVLCLIWGSTWFAIRILVEQVPPIRSAALRFAIAVVVLAPFVIARKMRLPGRRVILASAILSATMIALPYALIFWAETRVSSGMTAILFAAMPLVAGLYANHLDGHRMPQGAMHALLLGVGGVLLLLSSAFSTSIDQAVGASVLLLGVISAGISSVYAKREMASVNPLMSTLLQLCGGAVLLALMSAFLERGQPSHWNGPAVSALLFLSLGASVFAFPLYFWLLKEMEAYQIGTIQWFEPLVAVIEGSILLREPLSWRMIAGSAILLGSVVRVMTAREQDDAAVTLEITGQHGPD
jgi:drug/metabolite transporter (DMT)-like permease